MKRLALGALVFAAGLPVRAANEPERAYLRGLVSERFGKPSDAVAFYRQAAALDPSSRFLQETLAGLCLRLSLLDEALAAARKAASLAGPEPSAQVLLGRILLARGDRQGAAKAFDQALAVAPTDGEALIYAAFIRSSDKPQEAVRFLERYLKEDPGDLATLIRIAKLYETLKDFRKAEEFWRLAAERAPSDAEVHASLARLAEARGDRKTALAEYEAARFLEPRNVELLVLLGETYYRLGRAREAEETLGEALRLSPDDTAARFGLALLAEDAGDWEAAIAHMRLVAEGSEQPGVPLHLARLQSMAGRPKDALKTLRRLTRRNPRSAEAWYYTGLAWEDLGNRRRALRCFLKAAKLNPSSADARFHAASAWDGLGRFGKAEPLLMEAVKLDPDHAPALNYLGYSWADRGVRLQEALSLIRRAVKLEPVNGAYLDSLGWCLFKLGRPAEAEPALAQAAALEDEPAIWEHAGDALSALGREEEAVRAWQEGLLSDPGSRSLRKRLGGRGLASHVEPRSAPQAVLRKLSDSFKPLKAMAAGVTVSARRYGLPASVDGVFYYMKPRLFRVEVLGGFMAPSALVVANADGVHAAAVGGAAPELPGSGAWFDALGDVFSGALALRFDDPSVAVELKGPELVYRRAGTGELSVDGRKKTLSRAVLNGVSLRFDDYRDVDGFPFPGEVRVDLPDGTSLTVAFRRVRVNIPLEADLFRTPAGTR